MIKSVKRLGAAVLSAVMMLTAVATPLGDNLPMVRESTSLTAGAESGSSENFGCDAFIMYAGDAWEPAIWNDSGSNLGDDGTGYTWKSKTARINKSGTYTVAINDITAKVVDDETGDIITTPMNSNNAIMFAVEIEGLSTALGISREYDSSTAAEKMQYAKSKGVNITDVKIVQVSDGKTKNIPVDINKIYFGELESSGDFRIEIYNEYASTRNDPPITTSDISFNESISVTFTIEMPEIKEYSYTVLDDGSIEITNYAGIGGDVVIPETINGKKVTRIGSKAFYENSKIKNVTIPENVTFIDYKAFSNCYSLDSVNLPSTIEYISSDAFWCCVDIEKFTVADGNPYYCAEDGVLYSLSDDKNNRKKDSLVCYPTGKYDKSTMRYATRFTVPDGVESIGENAFCFSRLEKVVLPGTVKYIGSNAFYYNESLNDIQLTNVETIGDFAFLDCVSLTKVQLLNAEWLSDGAFYDCTSLESVKLPDGKSDCTIASTAFINTEIVNSQDTEIKYVDNWAVVMDNDAENVVIVKGTKGISQDLFTGSSYLKSVVINEGLTRLDYKTFKDCTELESVKLPESLTDLGYRTFENCTSLKTVNIPSGVTVIPGRAFYMTGIKSVTLPENLKEIKEEAFKGCESLTDIKIPANVEKIRRQAFVDTGIVNSQKTAVKYIGEWLVAYDGVTKSVNIKDGTKYISDYVFEGDYDNKSSLTTVTFPDSLIYIGEGAFSRSSLTGKLILPKNLTTIDSYAFSSCDAISEVTIPMSVTKAIQGHTSYDDFDDYHFGSSSSFGGVFTGTPIEIMKFEKGAKFISGGLTAYCEAETVIIPEGVEELDENSFWLSHSLKKIYFPSTLKKVGEWSFNCRPTSRKMAISDIYYGGSKEQWDNISFADPDFRSATIHFNCKEDDVFAGVDNVNNFKVKSISDTNVTLQWDKNATAGGYNIEQYKGGKWVNVAKITSNATTSYTVKGLAAGTAGYKFRMRAVKDSVYSNYTSVLTVNTNPYGVGGFKCSSKTSTSVTLKWNKGTTASGYQLQQYKGGKWVTIYTGTKATNTSYTVKKLKAGTAGYRFRIRAYKTYGNTKQYGSWSSEVKVNTNPYGVGGFKCSSKTSTSVTLKWNKGTTASGYQLQQYKGGKWVTIYTGTKATNTSYTVKKLKAGTAGYRFRIRAYKTYGNTKQYGSWSSEVKVNTNPYGVGGFKCSSKTSTSVTLKWNKGTTASGYQLQQYKNGKWVTIYTGTKATNTSYTVKGLKAGTAGYRFRIRAYKTYGNTKQYGSWSSEVKVNTNPYGVGGFKAKSTAKNSITLGWNKGTTASGYQLQQYKGGKWVIVYTGTKATSTSYTVKSLKANTSYKFRIRAYKTYGNTKQYGSWSSTLTVKTKR